MPQSPGRVDEGAMPETPGKVYEGPTPEITRHQLSGEVVAAQASSRTVSL